MGREGGLGGWRLDDRLLSPFCRSYTFGTVHKAILLLLGTAALALLTGRDFAALRYL